jgi:hypothetical protein
MSAALAPSSAPSRRASALARLADRLQRGVLTFRLIFMHSVPEAVQFR